MKKAVSCLECDFARRTINLWGNWDSLTCMRKSKVSYNYNGEIGFDKKRPCYLENEKGQCKKFKPKTWKGKSVPKWDYSEDKYGIRKKWYKKFSFTRILNIFLESKK